MCLCLTSSILILLSFLVVVFIRKVTLLFGDVTFDQLLFHVMLPKGTLASDLVQNLLSIGWAIRLFLVIGLVVALSVMLLSSRRLGHFAARLGHFAARGIQYMSEHLVGLALLCSLTLFLLVSVWFGHRFQVVSSIVMLFENSAVLDESLRQPELHEFRQADASGKSLDKAKRPNLILIISESLEATFRNEGTFEQNLLLELESLRKAGDVCEEHMEVRGSHYTIASMYSLHYGLPLLYFQAMSGAPTQRNVFAGNAVSIFDVLDAHGYNILHLQGTSLKFAAQGEMFAHLRHARCIGLENFVGDEYPVRQSWGLYDQDLFDRARKEAAELARVEQPFALSIQTIDNHFGNSLQPGEKAFYGDARDIIRLQSRIIADFVTWCRQQEFAENTVIAIIGDHNMMVKSIGHITLPEKKDRRIFNCILNAKCQIPMRRHLASEFDFAPTLLDALSFQWPDFSLGLGRSLYRENPTILDTLGVDGWNREARKGFQGYARLIRK